jgi:tRNA-dihydrouridine synthase
MMKQTGVDGVVVGRGCLGRPWLFGDLERAITAFLTGREHSEDYASPNLGAVADAFYRHEELLSEFFEDEGRACRDIRKHVAWYFKGYPIGGEFRAALALTNSLVDISSLLATLDRSLPFPCDDAVGPRGRLGGARSCSLPEKWLDSSELSDSHRRQLQLAEQSVSGG